MAAVNGQHFCIRKTPLSTSPKRLQRGAFCTACHYPSFRLVWDIASRFVLIHSLDLPKQSYFPLGPER